MKFAIFLLVTSAVSSGQAPGTAPPRYEVASIKATTDGDPRTTFRIEPGGAVIAGGLTLRRLLMTAYNVQGFRIIGGPDWLSSRCWELQAKPDRAASPVEVRPMLRALLEERFRLHTHAETRKLPVYTLAADRKGSKVPTTKDATARPTIQTSPGSIRMTNAASATFAGQLSYALGRPVIDHSNLTGFLDFSLLWAPEPGEDGGPDTAGLPPGSAEQVASTLDGPSIFTAIRDQLGLRLKAERGPVQVVIIDAVQLPIGN